MERNGDRLAIPEPKLEEKIMSVLGIAGSSLLNYLTQDIQGQGSGQQFQQQFQQLGQDLQSGNLSAAQADFTTLQQDNPQVASNNGAQNNSPIAQAFNQLSQDLQSGNISGAQQQYTTIQQDFQSAAQNQGVAHHHHDHGGGGAQSQTGAISQLFNALGSALQTGNLSNAQQIYSSLQQDLQQITQGGGAGATAASATTGLSVNG
jgi:outer membrane protein assembly factor BamD (BamD/ComL family)